MVGESKYSRYRIKVDFNIELSWRRGLLFKNPTHFQKAGKKKNVVAIRRSTHC